MSLISVPAWNYSKMILISLGTTFVIILTRLLNMTEERYPDVGNNVISNQTSIVRRIIQNLYELILVPPRAIHFYYGDMSLAEPEHASETAEQVIV